MPRSRLTSFLIYAVVVAGLASVAGVLAVQNRPSPLAADSATESVPVAENQPLDRVSYAVTIGDRLVQVAPLQSEELNFVIPAAPEPQPVVQVTEVPLTEQPTPATEPTLVIPTLVPTVAPILTPQTDQPPVSLSPQVNIGVEPIITLDHLVQPGDTLFSLTQLYNTSVELMARRGIAADDLVAGAMITLPIANPNYCLASQPYVVREHETAYSIAKRLGTTHEAIRDVNGLGEDYAIRMSDVLCIP